MGKNCLDVGCQSGYFSLRMATDGYLVTGLDSDEVIKAALPEDMLRVFMHYKNDEWEKFLSAVTQWDVDTYLDVLP